MLFSVISEPDPGDSLMIQIRELWKKTNKPFAFSLLGLMTISRDIPIPFLQSAAMSALGFIVMSHLFTLVDIANNARRRRSFQDIADAKKVILQHIREAYERDRYVTIQWLGMTMFNAWGILT